MGLRSPVPKRLKRPLASCAHLLLKLKALKLQAYIYPFTPSPI